MQTHRVHTSASENPHMFFRLELIKKGSSSVSPKLTFAFSSFIKNLTCEKEDQPNFYFLKKRRILFGGSFNFTAFHQASDRRYPESESV